MPPVTDRHRKLHSIVLNLPRVHVGLCRHDVVERREVKSATRKKINTEILGVAVRSSYQPKDDLSLEELSLV